MEVFHITKIFRSPKRCVIVPYALYKQGALLVRKHVELIACVRLISRGLNLRLGDTMIPDTIFLYCC